MPDTPVWQGPGTRSRAEVEATGPWTGFPLGPTVRRVRGHRGQTAAETMGVLLLVSAIVFMLVTSDTPARVADRTQEIVCEIGGGDDCGAGTVHGPMIPADDGPHDGPALGDGGPFPVLPF